MVFIQLEIAIFGSLEKKACCNFALLKQKHTLVLGERGSGGRLAHQVNHRASQKRGCDTLFGHYRSSVGEIVREYTDKNRSEAPRFIRDNRKEQPRLETVAEAVNIRPFQQQRIFKEWAGVLFQMV